MRFGIVADFVWNFERLLIPSVLAVRSAAVLAALAANAWTLTDILVTHHHGDHVEGIPALKQRFPKARVVAPAKDKARIPGAGTYVAESDDVAVGSYAAKIIETPGHTRG